MGGAIVVHVRWRKPLWRSGLIGLHNNARLYTKKAGRNIGRNMNPSDPLEAACRDWMSRGPLEKLPNARAHIIPSRTTFAELDVMPRECGGVSGCLALPCLALSCLALSCLVLSCLPDRLDLLFAV